MLSDAPIALIAPTAAAAAQPLVILFDVDNTLLDNDRFGADLRARLSADFGEPEALRYRAVYEALRDELGYADYLGALQRFRGDRHTDPALLRMSDFLLDYPFGALLYPHALEVVAHLRTLGTAAILSDGDIVFQPRKIRRSGLWDAFAGNVIVELHKQAMLEPMQRRFPAAHYAMVDDKPGLLAEMKRRMGDRLTTVFVRQGHYAAEAGDGIRPSPDRSIERIGDLLGWTRAQFLPDAGVAAGAAS